MESGRAGGQQDRRGPTSAAWPINPNATYSVTCNNFMATGGDGFTTFMAGTNQVGGPIDLDVLIQYVEDHTPFTAGTLDRITRA